MTLHPVSPALCIPFAGLQTTEQQRTRANRLPLGPAFLGVFARVRFPSRFSNQSGRLAVLGFIAGN